MKRKFGVIILSLFIISIIGVNTSNTTPITDTTTTTTPITTTTEEPAGPDGNWEWKVVVGDTKIYTISKFYMDYDGDGNFAQDTANILDEEGNQATVTLKKGTTIKVEIVDTLTTGSPASVKLTFDDNVTTLEGDHYNMPFLDYPFISQKLEEARLT